MDYATSPLFKDYFEMSCWKPAEPTIPDISTITADNLTPPVLAPDEIPSEIVCPSGKQMYGYSPVRENEARDSEQVANLNIAKLEKEYWNKYQLDLKFQYDIASDTYYACGDKYVLPAACPSGEARDKDGVCKPNKITQETKCCDIALKVPANPMEMLPLSALLKKQNELGNLNQDVLLDIIGENNLKSISDIRKKATHGVAMGILNQNVDTGQSTGFGMFRGLEAIERAGLNDDGNAPKPVYMIGFLGNPNFVSAIINGLAGPVDLSTLPGYSSGMSVADYSYNITQKKEEPNSFIDWIYQQENNGAFDFVELRSEYPNIENAWRQFSQTENSGIYFYNGGSVEAFAVHNENRKTRITTELWNNPGALYKARWTAKWKEEFNWGCLCYRINQNKRWDGISGNSIGITSSYTFDKLLLGIDKVCSNANFRQTNPNRVVLILLNKAEYEKEHWTSSKQAFEREAEPAS